MLSKIFNNQFFISIKNFYSNHKKTAILIGLVIIFIIWKIYSSLTSTAGEIKYVTANVVKGTIVASVSGSGQVSSSNQLDLKPKATGDVTYIGVVSGQHVKAGTLLVSLDASDARKAVRDAEISLASANLALKKLKIQNSAENISADLMKAYDDGFSAVSDTFIDLPDTLLGIQSLLNSSSFSENVIRGNGNTALSYRSKAETLYYQAQNSFEKNRINFSKVDRNSPRADIESIINETYNTTHVLSDAVKNLKNLVDFLVQDSGRAADYTTSQSALASYTSSTDGHLSSLSSAKSNINNYKDTSVNSGFDIESSVLSVKQKENALSDAKDKLSDYYVYAPFDGVVAKIPVKKLDSVNSSTTVATFIADQNIAEIPLNEVDIAKVKIGQKATLTFDAIPDLTITGTTSEMDTVGTVSQGVVTYNIKIGFDMNDERVKPNMSVSAAIITDTVNDAIYVPNSAVKSRNGKSYVEVFTTPLVAISTPAAGTPSKIAPIQKPVEIGLANDYFTQIISGIEEGEQVVSRTIASTTAKAAAPSFFGSAPASRTKTTNATVPKAN